MIFNKTNNGAAELKELIGFIYKSSNFTNLTSYIGFAERDIRKIISDEVFSLAEEHYNSDNYNATPDEDHPEYLVLDSLVKKIQLPLALHALRRYLPSSDVQHTDKGRQIFISENEKPAFEWQTEKDNDNLLSLAHEATDLLLEYLDLQVDYRVTSEDDEGEGEGTILIPWGTSAAYLATKELFVNTVDQFEKVFSIGGSRYTYLSLVPFMRRVQESDIKTCFTAEKYAEICEQIIDKEISDSNRVIINMASEAIVLITLGKAIKRLSVEVLPSGIFQNVHSGVVRGKNPAPMIDRNAVSELLTKDGQRELQKLKEHLVKVSLIASGESYTVDDPTERIDPDNKYVRL
ncbi:MAG TPA: hypothetical protein PKN44_10155 [Bacteroidales bacterium]|nr:hypothetical protein [Bacteroidales bacterium]